MCPVMGGELGYSAKVLAFAVKVFLLLWIIFVPIVITARLEKIIKLLDDKNKK